jgi:ankyrin repeat protein
MTPFTVAVANGHSHVAADLLATRSVDLNAKDKNYQTAVYYAIKSHDHEMTTLLLFNREVEVNIQDRLQRTPFWYAVRCNNPLATKYLLMRGANPNIPDVDCIAPLNIAIIERYTAILRLLLDKYEVDISPQLNLAFSMVREAQLPVCVAVYVGNHHALRDLLRRGADVNAHDSLGYSLLHLAVRKADSVMVKLLLGHKCLDINRKTRDKSSFTALHEAAAGGCPSMVNLLLSKEDIDMNVKDINGRTPLWWATRNNHPFIAKRLLAESGVDANAASTEGSTPLHHAVCHGSRLMMLTLLAEERLNPNICAKDGLSPLGWAAAKGDRVMVNLLLTRTDTQPSFACFKLALGGGYYGILFRLLRHSYKDL